MGFIKPMEKNIRTRKNKIQGKKTDFAIPPVLARLMKSVFCHPELAEGSECSCRTEMFRLHFVPLNMTGEILSFFLTRMFLSF